MGMISGKGGLSLLRITAKLCSEEELISQLQESLQTYALIGGEEEKRSIMTKMMLLTTKWGDEMNGTQDISEIVKSSEEIETLSELRNSGKTFEEMINDGDI